MSTPPDPSSSTPDVVAILQARVSSSRLPAKVLKPILGRPMIGHHIDRLQRCRTIDRIIVATSVEESDDAIARFCAAEGIGCYRGPLGDVLARFEGAAREYEPADHVVRLTGDCPLIDPAIIDGVVRLLVESGVDYASNIDPPTYADGLDVECFTRAVLDRAAREALRPAEREHVTLWMRTDEAGLDRRNLSGVIDSSQMRLTVDYPDDLEVVRELVAGLGGKDGEFDLYDMMRALDRNRDLLQRNRHLRNEALSQ